MKPKGLTFLVMIVALCALAAPVAAQPTPFMIYGWVSYENDTECNGPVVNITNLGTSNNWSTENLEIKTNASYNYYQLMLANGTDVNATEILQFNVTSSNGNQTNITEHMITQENITDGGLFNFNITLKAPDLNVTEKYETAEDGTFSVTYNVTNIGGGDAGPSTIAITTTAGDSVTGSVPALAAGQSNTSTVTGFNCPCGTTVTVTVCADSTSVLDESNEDNNCLQNDHVCPVCPEPDLNITDKFETFLDGNFTVNYTVKNIGAGDAGASNTTIYIDGVNVSEDPVPALVSGENYTSTVGHFDCSCGKTLNVTVCADNDNVVDESNETNNCEANIVKCPGIPDLVVEKSVELVDGNFTVSYTVTNIGCGPAGESTTCKYVNGSLEETQPCPALGSGESHSGAFDPEPCPCGETLNVTVCADNDNVVAESNETNNCEVNIVKCPGVPDLVVEKTVTIEDGSFTVTYTVANVGGGDAGASNTTIYIDGVNAMEDPVLALATGANYTNTVGPFDCPCGTTINITVCADNGNAVTECNETNNCEVNIVECPGIPDLVVEKTVTITDGNFSVNYTVTNFGCGLANESTTCKYVDGVLKESQICPALGSGENHSGTFEPEHCPCGATLNVTVCADCGNVVEESNETNNCEVNFVECPEALTNVATYDFSDLTSAGVDKWAYRYQINPKPPTTKDVPAIEFVGTDRKGEYTMISKNDHKMQKDSTNVTGYYAAHRFVFNITEPADSIVEIEVQWTGKGVTRHKGQSHGAALYIGNGTGYEQLGNTSSRRRETLTGNITVNAKNYIDAGGNLTILVVQNANQTITPKGRALVSMLSTDYVRADIILS